MIELLVFQAESEARGRNPNPSPTAQRASPAGIEVTTTQQYRSLSVRLALSLVPFRPQRHLHDCAPGIPETHMVGSERFVCVLCKHVTFADSDGASRFPFTFDKVAAGR